MMLPNLFGRRRRNRGQAAEPRKAASPESAIPLEEAPLGHEVVLADVAADGPLRHRLAEMGLRPGVRLVVLQRGRPGPFMLGIGDLRLVLGQGLGQCVSVYATE